MADKTVTVKPSGGTYTSLNAALNGEFALTPNLVTAAEILTVECYAMQDTTHCVFPDFTADATHYVRVIVPKSERHTGTRSSSAYRLEVTGVNEAIWLGGTAAGFTRLEGLQIKNATNKGVDGLGAGTVGASYRFSDCLIYDCAGAGISANKNYQVVNTVFMHNTGAGMADSGGGGTKTAENCVSVNNGGTGFTSITVKNCYSGGNTGADYLTSTLTTCYSEDGTQSSPTAAWSTSSGGFFTNVTAGTEDVHIGAASALKDVGTDLSGDAGWIEPDGNVDIVGTPRVAPWDVGVFELAALVVPAGDPLLFNELSGPGVDYGPYAFFEDRGVVPSGPLTVLQDVTATTVAVTASMVKQVNKFVTATASAVTASVVKQVNKLVIATSVVVTASMATVKVKLQAMTATTVVVTGSMVKQVNKILSSTAVAVTASFVRQVNKFLTATAVVVTASLTTIKVKLLAMTATTVVVTASMVRSVGKLLTATSVAVTASLTRQVGKRLTATTVVVTAALSTIKVKLVTMTATAVVATATMLRRTNTTLSATVATSATIVKAITHRLTAATVSVTASMVAQFGVVAQFFLKAFDAVLGHPLVRDDPEDADYTSDPKGKMGSNPQQGGFD